MTARKLIAMPLLWFFSGIIIAGVSVATIAKGHQESLPGNYYVSMQAHYSLSLAAAFGAFALLFLLIERILKWPYDRRLAVLQFALMLGGSITIFGPVFWLVWFGSRLPARSTETALLYLSGMSWFGYPATLASLLIFIALLIEALSRRFARSKRAFN